MKTFFIIFLFLVLLPFSAPAQATDSLDKMELVFAGDYKRQEIKGALDKVMKLHSLEINEENYSRAASALISLRKSVGVNEIDILRCMYQPGSPAKTNFPNSAAICAVAISQP